MELRENSCKNGRSYIVVDNFNNFFRRNRRFIAKTNNNQITQAELLLKENITRDNSKDSFKEINIVPPERQALAGNNNDQITPNRASHKC